MKRRIAAAATSAALAVSGPAVAANRPAQRGQPRSPKPQVTRVAAAGSEGARDSLAALQRQEMLQHRRLLAQALAAELPAASPREIEHGLARSGADPATGLARSTGRSEDEIGAAFEAMARHAREALSRR